MVFDPYHKWFGILLKDQPPNHYRLLSLEIFESDLDVIEGAADRQMGFVRQYQSGEHAADAARILNELAAARICLLKPESKKAYDQQLQHKQAPIKTSGSIHQETNDITYSELASAPRPRKKKSAKRSKSANSNSVIALAVVVAVGILGAILYSRSSDSRATNRDTADARSPINGSARQNPATPAANLNGQQLPGATTSTGRAEIDDSRLNLAILHAEYGAANRWFDLTNRIRGAATPSKLVVVVDTGLVGGDPVFGAAKTLKLRYRLDDREFEEWVGDGNIVQLYRRENKPQNGSPNLRIYEALFGGGIFGESPTIDVTESAIGKIVNGHLQCSVGEIVQGFPPPQSAGFRALFIRYSLDGQMLTTATGEAGAVNLGDPLPVFERDKGPIDTVPLSILEAKYGANQTWVDFTERCATVAKTGRLFLTGNSDTFSAQDPVPFVRKSFQIRFRLDGRLYERTYAEDSLLYIETRQTTVASKQWKSLEILEAYWGRGILGEKTWADVTDRVNIENGKVNTPISEITQGVTEPIAGGKCLFLRYLKNGQVRTICVSDQDTLRLSDQ